MGRSLFCGLTEEWKQKLLALYPEYTVVYGVFQGKDKRLRITLHNPNTGISGKYMSYPKAVMEVHLGRRLITSDQGEEETVDHIDRNFLNNDISNLRVVKRKEHCSYDALRRELPLVSCIWCGKEFQTTMNQISTRSLNKPGPFCSKQCSGHYGKNVSETGVRKPNKKIDINFYRLNKDYILKDHFANIWYDSNCAKCGKDIKTRIINTPVYCSQDCIGFYNFRGQKTKTGTKLNVIMFDYITIDELVNYLRYSEE